MPHAGMVQGQEDALGHLQLSAPPFLHTSLAWLLSFFPTFSCFCSGTLLCCWLSRPAVVLCPSLWTRGTSDTLGLARLPWKRSKKPLLGGSWQILSAPSCLAEDREQRGSFRDAGRNPKGSRELQGFDTGQGRGSQHSSGWERRGISSSSPLGLCRGFLL